jgi:hypothetical protein
MNKYILYVNFSHLVARKQWSNVSGSAGSRSASIPKPLVAMVLSLLGVYLIDRALQLSNVKQFTVNRDAHQFSQQDRHWFS